MQKFCKKYKNQCKYYKEHVYLQEIVTEQFK